MGLIVFDLFSRWEDKTSNPSTTKANPLLPSPCRLHQWVGHSNLVSHHLTTCGLTASQVFHVRWRVVDVFSRSNCHVQHHKKGAIRYGKSHQKSYEKLSLTFINQNYPLVTREKVHRPWAPRHPVWWWPTIRQRRSRTSLQCSKTRLHGRGCGWDKLIFIMHT